MQGLPMQSGWQKIGLNEREDWEPAEGEQQFTLPVFRPARAERLETPRLSSPTVS